MPRNESIPRMLKALIIVGLIPATLFLYLSAAQAQESSIDEGEKLSHKCTMCHTFDKGGHNRFGPNLWNIAGSPIAHVDHYQFSDALEKVHDQAWTDEALDHFLTNPQAFAPGTKMAFAGMKNAEDRTALIAWLHTLSDNPTPPKGN